MLDVARDMAIDAGLTVGLEHIGLEEVIQRAGLPRSSVYRLWDSKEAFAADLLCHMAESGTWFQDEEVFDPETFAIVEATLARHHDLLASEAGRRQVMAECVRVAVGRDYEAFKDTPRWRPAVALAALLDSLPPGKAHDRVADNLLETERKTGQSVIVEIDYVAGLLGMRLRDPSRTLEHLVTAGRAMVNGLSLREFMTRHASSPASAELRALVDAPLSGTGIDGGPVEWTLAAFAYLALVDGFYEPDPGFRPAG
jgi:AcrR family transcriptional regulator